MKKYTVHKLNKSRGFTLVELVVAIALLAMVGVLATSVVLLTTRSRSDFEISAKSQSEITRAEKLFKDFIMQYDDGGYTISVDPTDQSLSVTDGAPGSEESPCTAAFNAGVFSCQMPDGSTKTEELGEVENITFEISGKMVCCTIELKQNSNPYQIIYTMRAANCS